MTKSCELQEFAISDERVKQLAEEYFNNLGKTVESSEVVGFGVYYNETVKNVRVELSDGEQYVGINEEGEVIVLSVLE